MKRFKYYQPNKKDLNDNYGDCTIRALCKAFDIGWVEAFKLTIPYCIEYQVSNIFHPPIKIRREIMEKLGSSYTGISVKRGRKRPTVDSFTREHKTGTYILNVANHEVTVVDGIYYDTWDSGHCCVYGYFTKK